MSGTRVTRPSDLGRGVRSGRLGTSVNHAQCTKRCIGRGAMKPGQGKIMDAKACLSLIKAKYFLNKAKSDLPRPTMAWQNLLKPANGQLKANLSLIKAKRFCAKASQCCSNQI